MKEKFLEVLRTTKQNVFVVAAKNEEKRQAMTVSSVFSVSLEPMSMAVSVNQDASLHDLLTLETKFSLNLLSSNQAEIAESAAVPKKEMLDSIIQIGKCLKYPS